MLAVMIMLVSWYVCATNRKAFSSDVTDHSSSEMCVIICCVILKQTVPDRKGM
jgi:hypothetical protein